MPLNDEDRKKGLEILKEMDLLKDDETPVSKSLLKQIIDMLYGTIWSRTENLSLKERSMITLTVLVALNRENELKSHLRGAQNLGIQDIYQKFFYCLQNHSKSYQNSFLKFCQYFEPCHH